MKDTTDSLRLVVQIPALNEEATIGDVIRRIPSGIPGVGSLRVVVVDDGSTDRTGAIARELGATVVRHAKPRGVGAAFRSGLGASAALDADIIVTVDADGQFDPADIPRVLGPIVSGEADFVTASRFADEGLAPVMPRAKRWGNDFMARWISRLTRRRFYDVSCGFRAYSREAYQRLTLMGDFTYTHESFLNLAFCGMRILEVPVRVRGVREHGKSRIANNLFRYGWRTAQIILRTYRDYRPVPFFGMIALALLFCSIVFLAFFGWIRLTTGQFTPFKWTGLVAAVFASLSLMVFFVGLVVGMLDRLRMIVEESLFRVRRLEQLLARPDRGGAGGDSGSREEGDRGARPGPP